MSDLKTLRESKKMTQKEAAEYLGISLRSYSTYENNIVKEDTPKYRFIYRELESFNPIDEEHGILSISEIQEICQQVLAGYDISYCYLFGSYAKNKAKGNSDVDLLVSGNVTGLRFFGLAEELREALHKQVDLLDLKQIVQHEDLLNEILKDGIKIYG